MRCIALMLVLGVPGAAFLPVAAEDGDASRGGGCRNLLSSRYAVADRQLVQGDLRVRWASTGPDAPADMRDRDGNGVPDVVDDLMTQLAAARDVYVRRLGLTNPLAQPRYKAAQTMTFFVLNMPRGNGLAFDEVTQLPPVADGDAGGNALCSLVAVVSNKLDFSRNVTGAHELFHFFQYGYAMFKAPWMLEGMARANERLFAGAAPSRSSTPAPDCQQATSLGYGASAFWTARWAARGGEAATPVETARLHYLNGQRVLAGGAIKGSGGKPGGSLRADLETLDRLSRRMATELNMPVYGWPEAVQRSDRFNDAMCAALQ